MLAMKVKTDCLRKEKKLTPSVSCLVLKTACATLMSLRNLPKLGMKKNSTKTSWMRPPIYAKTSNSLRKSL
jgi:hypothetical protein